MELRLNSPRGKFEITNMADDQVDLTPEDIPGASFIEEEIEKLTVAQLNFWLKCTSSGIYIAVMTRVFIQNLLSQGQEPASNENL